MSTVYALRWRERAGQPPRWLLFDAQEQLLGGERESKPALLRRWQAAHGKPAQVELIPRVHTPSEAAVRVIIPAARR